MAKAFRSLAEFTAAKEHGESAERAFIDLCGALGGSAMKIGSFHSDGQGAPLASAPPLSGQAAYFTAPDVVYGFAGHMGLAQVKSKKLQPKRGKTEAHFLLDDDQLQLLHMTRRHFPTLMLVIHSPDAASLYGNELFSFVNAGDLTPHKAHLHLRNYQGGRSFVLPASMLRPISHLPASIGDNNNDREQNPPLPQPEGRSRARDANVGIIPARLQPSSSSPLSGNAPNDIRTETAAAWPNGDQC